MAGSIGERRSFLRSFIETIEKSDSQVTINYTLPLPAEKVSIDHIGVLDIDLSGGPAWIRTHPPNYQPSGKLPTIQCCLNFQVALMTAGNS